MSAHNHDEEIIKSSFNKKQSDHMKMIAAMQKKAGKLFKVAQQKGLNKEETIKFISNGLMED